MMIAVQLSPSNSNNPLVYFDISIDQEHMGRMIIELRKDIVPKTAENFRALCTGECGIGAMGKPLHYKGINFHKVTRMYVAQSGDIVKNNGTCGESIYGPTFDDENFDLPHNKGGVVSMANYGQPNTNNSQFFITSMECEILNGTNVVVGQVLRGLAIISDMEQYVSNDGKPTQEIVISDCGELKSTDETDWGINDNDETDDQSPPYPQDYSKDINSLTSKQVMDMLIKIRSAGNYFYVRKNYMEARRKYRKAQRYCNYLNLSPNDTYHNDGMENNDSLNLDAFNVINCTNMAAVELKLSNYENAKNYCSEAIRLNPECFKAYYRRGQAEIGLNDYESAINDLTTALKLVPDNKEIRNELNNVQQLQTKYNRLQMNSLRKLFISK